MTVLTNGGYGHALGSEVVAWALREYCGVSAEDLEPLPLSADDIAPYAGTYHSPGGYIDLRQEGSDLFLQPIQTRSSLGLPIEAPPPPVRAGIVEGDRLLVLEDPMKGTQGEFLRGRDGEIQWLRLGKRIHRRERQSRCLMEPDAIERGARPAAARRGRTREVCLLRCSARRARGCWLPG